MSQLTTPSDPDIPTPPTIDPDPPLPQPEPDSPPITDAVAAGIETLEKTEPSNEGGLATADVAPMSAGEVGEASDGETPTAGNDDTEIIIGEIPDIHDLSVMRWTARCTNKEHDLLGHFDSREEAEQAGAEHKASAHRIG